MEFIGLAVLIFASYIYFLPAVLGWKKQNRVAILALNALLGWTLIGWVAALVWALTKDQKGVC